MNEYLSVVNTLLPVVSQGKSLDVSWDKSATPLAKEITYGVLRDYYHLNAIVGALVKKPLADKNLDLNLLLLAGLYSIDHIKRPDYASVNAVVESVIALGKPWAKGLVNGVLRNYIRKRETLDLKFDHESETNHPAWLSRAIEEAWPAQAGEIFVANNQHAPMTLRVNESRLTRSDYIEQLQTAEIESRPGSFGAQAVYLTEPMDITRLPGFAEGLVSVQDEASQLVADLLHATPGQKVLDACAAPGGKACHLLERYPGIELTALDVNADRSRQIRQNLTRLDLEATLAIADLRSWDGSGVRFERILLDAPCSATGIIRRHPDIKLLRRKSDIDKLVSAQLELLTAAWQLLEKGGVLVYSTCSILPAENDGVISQFLANTHDSELMPLTETWGQATDHGRQLLPAIDGNDGFYFARLVKARLVKAE